MEQAMELALRSGQGIIWCSTVEEKRTTLRIQVVAERQKYAVFGWTCTDGFVQLSRGDLRPPGSGPCTNLDQALHAVGEYTTRNIVVVFHDFPAIASRLERMPDYVRLLRQIINLDANLRKTKNAIVFIASSPAMPEELKDWVALVETPLPDAGERLAIVQSWIEANCTNVPCNLDEETIHGVVSIAAGMTSRQIQAALAKSAINRKGLGPGTLTDILAEKISVVKGSEVLRIVQVEDTVDSVGGLRNIKEYLARRRLAYGAAAERYGLPMPKGILIVGPPGTGKSLMAKVAANSLQLGLLHIDIGRLQGSLVGQSEERLRLALALAEAQAPAVMWLDELEKAFGGVGGPSGDSGVLQRQFGYLLNWMQEHKSPVFLVATANDIRRLPPEFLRKGRFDEIFFVDLPTSAERSEILTVVLRKHGQPTKGLVADALIGKLERFTGAEIEAAVTEGMYNAFFDGPRPLSAGDIEEAAARTVPLADQRRDEINELRQWGRVNARPAS